MKILYQRKRAIAIFFLTLFAAQLLPSMGALALTSGPSQPEVQSFQPAGTSDMVDLFSGDFSYNIPLFELPGPNGGYPFNLSYQSGISMDQEASWVGLGWNLQPGAINRQMRGLPDEFDGTDQVRTKMSMEPNVTVGMGAGAQAEFFGADGLSLKVGFSVYQNNYRGIGYSIDGSLGFGKATSSGKTIGIGFGLDSKDGVNLSPSLSLAGKNVNYGLSLGYNSKEGLQSISFDASIDKRWSTRTKPGKESKQRGIKFSTGASLSFAHPGYTPQITMPMRSTNLSATLKAGGAWWGIFGAPYVTGFYNEQWLANDKRWVTSPAYGYLNYQKAGGASALLDLNREKDGVVTKEAPNMAIPSLTYDIYSVNGQGISAMYRPMRNDYGVLRDQEVSSQSTGGSAGIDFGPAVTHAGANLSVNHSKSTSGEWRNDMSSKVTFTNGAIGSLYEPWYFKAHGEPTAEGTGKLNGLGGEKAVQVKLNGDRNSVTASTQLQANRREAAFDINPIDKSEPRKIRNQSIQSYTNEQILNGTREMLPHFQVKYIDQDGVERDFNRSDLPTHHIAAFTALTPEGLRYNYAIPAYNLIQEEVSFSARKLNADVDRVSVVCNTNPCGQAQAGEPYYGYSGTEKYLRRVETPKYAHSYLLTSIVGPDYVDVEGDGVSEKDLGYWVKFTYKKTTGSGDDVFRWRDPFSRAHLQEGWKSDPRDDKGSFVYGEKEMWYLARAETKSHIATFTISAREDGRGVLKKIQENDDTGTNPGNKVYRLDEIRLFTRAAGTAAPIKVTRFDYDYSLCQATFNSTSTGKGKLTLKKVWFEYGGSQRGQLNPYMFSYAQNPAYKMLAYDRWGNYKPAIGTVSNADFPYVVQDPNLKTELDTNVAAWSLTQIQLPSGGTVMVDYESDDYAYVQHKPAMQMMEMALKDDGELKDPSPRIPDKDVPGTDIPDKNLKVRFKLERPLSGSLTPQQQIDEALKYIDQQRRQLYFKILIALRKPSEGVSEYISGYADIDLKDLKKRKDIVGLEKNDENEGDFVYGFFHLERAENDRHPFSLRAWQHLRTNQPELANSGSPLKQTNDATERINQITSMGSVIDQVRQMVDGFYNFCSDRGWGREIDLGKSWIRLNSPDKIKYGGGLRVKQITMKDNWQHDEEGVYGQVYDYTTQEGSATISSGVASYEPFIGGDENPLRYAKKYTQSVPLRADNNLFFEYPINESYYPGPQVGYSKVSVMSLASASMADKPLKNTTLSDGKPLFPQGEGISYGTSGKTVHEFDTAKDFPVITDETEKDNKPFQLSVTIPFIGTVSISKLTASQGYSIVTNDMHGKQKKVSNYRQDKDGKVEPEPISWVKYNYATQARQYEQEKILMLANRFAKDQDDDQLLKLSSTGDITLGQETEFFMDMRQFEDNTWTGGVRLNAEILYFPFFAIPAFVPWPSVSKSETQLRTAVTNKVIFKSGILENVEAFDGGSLVKTKNEKWDRQTGNVVLTTVNNNFDAPIYSYNLPAYTQYQGMGAAYQNTGLTFTANEVRAVPNQTNQYWFAVKETEADEALYAGDEMLLYSSNASTLAAPLARAVYTGEEDGSKRWHAEQALAATSYKALIVRSGFRNQLSVSAGSITALEDPTSKAMMARFSKTIQVPK